MLLSDAKIARLALPLLGASADAWDHRLAPAFCAKISAPVDELADADSFARNLIAPLAAALPTAEDRLDILLAGHFDGGLWTASTGHLAGRFEKPLWGIAPTGRPVFLRYCRFDRWDTTGDVPRIAEIILLFDVPGLMLQADCWPLAPPLGRFILAPAPSTRDGVDLDDANPAEGVASLKAVEAMIAGLMRYDRKSLSSMRMVDFWHPDFWWFGPAAIGSFCGHADYERGHQGPFLAAFPDRIGGNHRARIGERAYVASTGWPSIRATHSGGDFLGLAPTAKPITMRVMDVWRAEQGLLRENWVFVDLVDLLRQLGVDVFARMRALVG